MRTFVLSCDYLRYSCCLVLGHLSRVTLHGSTMWGKFEKKLFFGYQSCKGILFG